MSIHETVFRTTLQVHAFMFEHADGLIGHRMLGVPCLMLRTTGRKTGQTRTNSLVYAKDSGPLLGRRLQGRCSQSPGLAAEPPRQAGGPGPDRRTRFPATGTEIAPDDPDYARVWKLVNDNNGNRYDAYQQKTSRPIPVVALSRTT